MESPQYASDEDLFDDGPKKTEPHETEPPIEEPSQEQCLVDGLKVLVSGVPPPPDVTNPDCSVEHFLRLWNENKDSFLWSNGVDDKKDCRLSPRSHFGIYFNNNTACEELEMLRKRYQERWVGAETTCLVVNNEDSLQRLRKLTASAKKRARRNGWAVSPGRRLSYLARRRNTFNSHATHRALVIDKKGGVQLTKHKAEAKRKSPRAKSALRPKRALFMSPEQSAPGAPPEGEGAAAAKTPEFGAGLQRLRRNLWRDEDSSKGKREEAKSKRRSCNRSLSFGDQPKVTPSRLSTPHKKKMLWAVAQALKTEGLTTDDPRFKPAVTSLYRQSGRAWLECRTKPSAEPAGPKESTSDLMLEVARRYLPNVLAEPERVSEDGGVPGYRDVPVHSSLLTEDIGKRKDRSPELLTQEHPPKRQKTEPAPKLMRLVVDLDRPRTTSMDGRLELFVPDELIGDHAAGGFIDASKIAESITKIAQPQVEPSREQAQADEVQSTINKRKIIWAVGAALRSVGIKTTDDRFRPIGRILLDRCKTALAGRTILSSDEALELAMSFLPEFHPPTGVVNGTRIVQVPDEVLRQTAGFIDTGNIAAYVDSTMKQNLTAVESTKS